MLFDSLSNLPLLLLKSELLMITQDEVGIILKILTINEVTWKNRFSRKIHVWDLKKSVSLATCVWTLAQPAAQNVSVVVCLSCGVTVYSLNWPRTYNILSESPKRWITGICYDIRPVCFRNSFFKSQILSSHITLAVVNVLMT